MRTVATTTTNAMTATMAIGDDTTIMATICNVHNSIPMPWITTTTIDVTTPATASAIDHQRDNDSHKGHQCHDTNLHLHQ